MNESEQFKPEVYARELQSLEGVTEMTIVTATGYQDGMVREFLIVEGYCPVQIAEYMEEPYR